MGIHKNEIDFITASHKHTIEDFKLISRFHSGSFYRMICSEFVWNTREVLKLV